MNTLETIALLLMCAAGIGLIYLVHRMIQSQLYIEVLLSDIWDRVKSTKIQIASLRHDLSLDRENVDTRFEELNARVHDTANSLHDHLQRNLVFTAAETRGEHQKTRKDIQEVKTALRDEEKDDQKAKAKARRKKKPSGIKGGDR